MQQKSNVELILEMIQSAKKYTAARIPNTHNQRRYSDAMDFVYGFLNYYVSKFETVQEQMTYLVYTEDLVNYGNKYEKEYFSLAIEQCSDIVESVNKRFVKGYCKDEYA